MRLIRRIPLALVAMATISAGLIGQSAGATTTATANPTTVVLHATLSGAQEVTGGGAPNGSGSATFILNTRAKLVCYVIRVSGIAAPTEVMIHQGAAGVEGGMVVFLPLTRGAKNVVAGCVRATTADINRIINNPAGFYVNVHNADFPAGAVRGQLG